MLKWLRRFRRPRFEKQIADIAVAIIERGSAELAVALAREYAEFPRDRLPALLNPRAARLVRGVLDDRGESLGVEMRFAWGWLREYHRSLWIPSTVAPEVRATCHLRFFLIDHRGISPEDATMLAQRVAGPEKGDAELLRAALADAGAASFHAPGNEYLLHCMLAVTGALTPETN